MDVDHKYNVMTLLSRQRSHSAVGRQVKRGTEAGGGKGRTLSYNYNG